ncbi:MAG: esterase-like activity of phytase family protein [Pirellulales bacterium]
MQLIRKSIFCRAAVAAAWSWATCSLSTWTAAQEPHIELIGQGTVSGTASDLSGLSDNLETGGRADQFGGLSAIEYSGEPGRFFALSDRGPGDGAARFECRFHELKLTLDPQSKKIECTILKTTLFRNHEGKSLSGSLEAPAADEQSHASAGSRQALDPEGFRLLGNECLVSDEYGPRVSIFNSDGSWLRDLSLPARCRLNASPQPGSSGVFPNRGLEGITVDHKSGTIIAALQGPLIEDGALENGKCFGVNTRWFAIDRSGQVKQFVYQLDDESSGVSEVLHWDTDRVLVLERDSLTGVEAKIKRIYVAELSDASDVSDIASLPRKGLPESIKPVSKRLLIDLLDSRFGLGGEQAAEKPEGLCWGPLQPNGARTLWLSVDNDFDPEVTTKFYAFSIRE